MDQAGDDLLAGSRLAGDEDGRVRGRHPSYLEQDFLPGARGADDASAALSLQLARFGGNSGFLREPVIGER